MNGIFRDLEDEEFSFSTLTGQFNNTPAAAIEDFPCTHTVNNERVTYSFGECTQNIRQYALLLHSENPDHYKRAGALLHALYRNKIITDVAFAQGKDDVEGDSRRASAMARHRKMSGFPFFMRLPQPSRILRLGLSVLRSV